MGMWMRMRMCVNSLLFYTWRFGQAVGKSLILLFRVDKNATSNGDRKDSPYHQSFHLTSPLKSVLVFLHED